MCHCFLLRQCYREEEDDGNVPLFSSTLCYKEEEDDGNVPLFSSTLCYKEEEDDGNDGVAKKKKKMTT